MIGKKIIGWILVADGSRASIYASQMDKHNLVLLQTIKSDNARLHNKDLGSDKPGGIFERNTPASRIDLHAKEEEYFAHEVAKLLNQESYENKINKLVLIVSPKFLGILRPLLSKHTTQLISKEISKDLTHMDEEILKNYIWENNL